MLEQIRDWTKGWFAWVVIIALAIVFALWGVYGYMGVTGAESEVAVTVNGRDISRLAVDRYAQQLQQQAVANGDKTPLNTLRQQALDQLILQTLLIQDAQKRGFTADKTLVDKFIIEQPEFQQDGKFSPELFEQVTRQSGYNPYELRELLVDDIIVGQLRAGIMGSAFILPAEVQRFLAMQQQSRDIQYLTFPADYFVQVREIPEEEIQQYYQAHQNQWQTPEQVSIEYIELTADNAAQGVTITDAEIRAFYDANKETYTTPEQRHVRHILLALPANATPDQMDVVIQQGLQIKEKLSTGTDFATLAGEYSIDTATANKGGDLGWVQAGILPADLDKLVFAATPNTVSDPSLTAHGVDIFEVTAIKPAQTQSLEEVKTTIADQLQKQRIEQRFIELQDELTTLTYEMPDSLSEAADTMKLPLKTTGFFTADQGAGDTLTQNPLIREAAFSDSVLGGENSSPLTLAPEHVLVLRIQEHQPTTVKPLDQVHSQVIKAIQDEGAVAHMSTTLDQWVTQLNNGELAMSALPERVGGGEWTKVPNLTRTGNELNTSPLIRDYAFNLSKPGTSGISAGWLPVENNQYALVVVNQIHAGTIPNQDSPEWQSTSSGLTALQQQADYAEYLQELRQSADITMHSAVTRTE